MNNVIAILEAQRDMYAHNAKITENLVLLGIYMDLCETIAKLKAEQP
jgi:hypothetical protein